MPLPVAITSTHLDTMAYYEIGDAPPNDQLVLIDRLPEDLAIYDCVTCIDLSSETETDPSDGIHLTAASHGKIGMRLAKLIKEAI